MVSEVSVVSVVYVYIYGIDGICGICGICGIYVSVIPTDLWITGINRICEFSCGTECWRVLGGNKKP